MAAASFWEKRLGPPPTVEQIEASEKAAFDLICAYERDFAKNMTLSAVKGDGHYSYWFQFHSALAEAERAEEDEV